MEELARLMTALGDRLTAYVLMVAPEGVAESWAHSDLAARAAEIRGVHVVFDRGGVEARLFRAETSGETIVCGADRGLLFHGGITVARGHAGDSAGVRRIRQALTGTPERADAPVFGCPLHASAGGNMSEESRISRALAGIDARSAELFVEARQQNFERVDRMFAALMLAQWLASIVVALTISPSAWAGKTRTVHAHVRAALVLGGLITSLPVFLAHAPRGIAHAHGDRRRADALVRPAHPLERRPHRDALPRLRLARVPRVPSRLAGAAAGHHRGRRRSRAATALLAESVFGLANPEWWRFLEPAAWVGFIDFFLLLSCINAYRDMKETARKRGEAELLSRAEQEKSQALDDAMKKLQRSRETLVRSEKLAAVGQLAASVGHELRNPLAAVRNAHVFGAQARGSESAGRECRPADQTVPRRDGARAQRLDEDHLGPSYGAAIPGSRGSSASSRRSSPPRI